MSHHEIDFIYEWRQKLANVFFNVHHTCQSLYNDVIQVIVAYVPVYFDDIVILFKNKLINDYLHIKDYHLGLPLLTGIYVEYHNSLYCVCSDELQALSLIRLTEYYRRILNHYNIKDHHSIDKFLKLITSTLVETNCLLVETGYWTPQFHIFPHNLFEKNRFGFRKKMFTFYLVR